MTESKIINKILKSGISTKACKSQQKCIQEIKSSVSDMIKLFNFENPRCVKYNFSEPDHKFNI